MNRQSEYGRRIPQRDRSVASIREGDNNNNDNNYYANGREENMHYGDYHYNINNNHSTEYSDVVEYSVDNSSYYHHHDDDDDDYYYDSSFKQQQREQRTPGRIRSSKRPATTTWISLYPSTHNLPDIPLADVEFNKASLRYSQQQKQEQSSSSLSLLFSDSTRTRSISPDTFGYASLSQNLILNDDDDDDDDEHEHDHHDPNGSCWPNPVEDDIQEGGGNGSRRMMTTTTMFDRPLVEVSPGHWTELRGSEETWDALRRNFSKRVICFCCDCPMKVIYDAAMVLCPECRMINPLDGNDEGGCTGLGLGVKEEEQEEHKDEIHIGSNHSIHSMKSTTRREAKAATTITNTEKKKVGNLKDDVDSGHSIHRMRERTTNLGPRAVKDIGSRHKY